MRWLGVVALAACLPVGADRVCTCTRLATVLRIVCDAHGRSLPYKPATAAVCQSSEQAIHNSCTAVLHDSSRIADSAELSTRALLIHSCTVGLCSGDAKLSTSGDVTVRQSVLFTTWLCTSVSSTRRYVLYLLVIIILDFSDS